ncbi:MAG: GNAT family N-acetyltransferase [Actinomycetota bacterium]
MVTVRAVRPHELRPAQRQGWLELLKDNDELVSPYFHPEYVTAVGEVLDNVYVAVLRAGSDEAYLPFQRGRLGIGGPVGGGFSDYQGIIAPPGFEFDPRRVVVDLGLRLLDFDHQLASQAAFTPYATGHYTSPYLDLSHGFDAYLAARRQSGSGRLSQFQRKGRKLGREVGELRLVYSDADPAALRQVIDWKRDQCLRTGAKDFFAWGWTNAILDHIHHRDVDGFAGVLTSLYAGDRLVAGHFGMRTDRALHWWFPSYDAAYGRYSPGGVLLTMLAERAAAEGITMLDLGRGGEGGYKSSFATDAVDLIGGWVGPTTAVSAGRDAFRSSKRFALTSPALEPVRSAAKRARNEVRDRVRDRLRARIVDRQSPAADGH